MHPWVVPRRTKVRVMSIGYDRSTSPTRKAFCPGAFNVCHMKFASSDWYRPLGTRKCVRLRYKTDGKQAYKSATGCRKQREKQNLETERETHSTWGIRTTTRKGIPTSFLHTVLGPIQKFVWKSIENFWVILFREKDTHTDKPTRSY